MPCIHFKFNTGNDYDSITFDGLNITVADLKKAIFQRKKLNDAQIDLKICDAITKTHYKEENEFIPKNTSVIVSRIPLAGAPVNKGPKTLLVPDIAQTGARHFLDRCQTLPILVPDNHTDFFVDPYIFLDDLSKRKFRSTNFWL